MYNISLYGPSPQVREPQASANGETRVGVGGLIAAAPKPRRNSREIILGYARFRERVLRDKKGLREDARRYFARESLYLSTLWSLIEI